MRRREAPRIPAAPSLADITAARGRVGKVDFTARLADPTGPSRDETDESDESDDPVVPGPTVRDRRPIGAPPPDAADVAMPFIMLPPRTDGAPTSGAAATTMEIATARDDLPRDRGEVLDIDDTDDLDDTDGTDGTDGTDVEPGTDTAEDVDARDDAPVGSVAEVAEIADTVIAAIRRMNDSHERHVEALELETARRCEMLMAQAELDAELIRLQARREAHAIISAARIRAAGGGPAPVGPDDSDRLDQRDQLGEIGETFSRFAEEIESTVADGPGLRLS